MSRDLLKRLDKVERAINPPKREKRLIVILGLDEAHQKVPATKLRCHANPEHVFTRTEDESEKEFTDRVNLELGELFPDRLVHVVIQERD